MHKERKEYTWEQFGRDVKEIARWAESQEISEVFGIPRGGLVIAVAVSHQLRAPLVLNESDITERTLVVDDIVDTGESIKRLVDSTGVRPVVASIYAGKDSVFAPDFSLYTKDRWIIFPWETLETSKYDGTVL